MREEKSEGDRDVLVLRGRASEREPMRVSEREEGVRRGGKNA